MQPALAGRQAHNLKVTGSNPVPATNISIENNMIQAAFSTFAGGGFLMSGPCPKIPASI